MMKKMKIVASLAVLLNTSLFGSYYSVAKAVLGRVDPIVFTFFTMMTLVPPAICILAFSWRHMTRAAVKSGFLLGSCLCLGLFTLSVALKYNSATGTAFFPALNGLLAALFTWLFLRQPITKATWYAAIISVVGAVQLMLNASMGGARGTLIAFIGGMFCTFYIFLADQEQKDPSISWPLFGVELLTMALWANLLALLFGDWQAVHLVLPNDVGVILYIGLGTICLPTLITVLLQRYISPVTVSFISILEPLLGALVAYLYLHEVLPLDGYLGGGLVVAGALIQTCSNVAHPAGSQALHQRIAQAGQRLTSSSLGLLLYPVLCCGVGVFVVCKIGGFPPPSWSALYAMAPHFSTFLQAGRVTGTILVLAQAFSWLVAWLALVIMGFLATYRALDKIFATPEPVPAVQYAGCGDSGPEGYAVALTSMGTSALEPPAPVETTKLVFDMRLLRQRGLTVHTSSASKRGGEKPQVRERRMARRVRLARLAATESPSLGTVAQQSGNLVAQANQGQYSDPAGNRWLWWDDTAAREVRER